MISLHCPSTIMRRSAADGNHMPRGLASPSQSLLRGEEERKMREDGRKAETRKQERKRGGEGRGGAQRLEEVEIIRRQSAASGAQHVCPIWRWAIGKVPPPVPSIPSTPPPRPIWCGSWRNCRLERVFQLLNEQQVTLCAAHLDF